MSPITLFYGQDRALRITRMDGNHLWPLPSKAWFKQWLRLGFEELQDFRTDTTLGAGTWVQLNTTQEYPPLYPQAPMGACSRVSFGLLVSMTKKIKRDSIFHLTVIEHPVVPTSPHYSGMGWFLLPVSILPSRCLQSQQFYGTDLKFQGNVTCK